MWLEYAISGGPGLLVEQGICALPDLLSVARRVPSGGSLICETLVRPYEAHAFSSEEE